MLLVDVFELVVVIVGVELRGEGVGCVGEIEFVVGVGFVVVYDVYVVVVG